MINRIFNKTSLPIMERLLNITSTRQRLIASNIANAYTPGYQKQDVDFKQSLASAEKKQTITGLRTEERHMPIGDSKTGSQSEVAIVTGGRPDMEKEMGDSAENQLLYTTAAQIAKGNFTSLRTAIRGRI